MTPDYSQTDKSNSTDIKVSYIMPPHPLLAHRIYSRGNSGQPLRIVLVHGFTQTSQHFDELARRLVTSIQCEVVSVDLPGHGRSKNVETDLTQTSDALSELGKDSVWVGYSLGSRHVLTMCARYPEHHWRVLLSGINPGIEIEKERIQRYQADLSLADNLQSMEGDVPTFHTFLEQWTNQPLFLPRTMHPMDIEWRLENSPRCLAQSLRLSSVGKQADYWPAIVNLRGKFTLLTGSCDKKYLEIAGRICSLNKSAFSSVTIDNRGHAALFDDLDTTSAVIQQLSSD